MQAADLTPRANAQSIYLPGRTGASDEQHYHIFYLTGNPGCIAYYHTFLTLLQEKVLSAKEQVSLSIYGESYPNYTDEEQGLGHALSLRQLIAHCQNRLLKYAQAQQKATGTTKPIKVIVSGHSLGTYVGLEVIRWWQEQGSDSPAASAIDIVGYLGLWCTVTWLSKSPSGRVAKPVVDFPGFLPTFCAAAETFVGNLPLSLLLPLVKWFTKFPDDSAVITCNFLKSKCGIRQALYLARDELNEISEDRWTDELWGTAGSLKRRPKLVFHFGATDHWVANEIRDELIKLRGRNGDGDGWKPVMEVDKHGIPHAFCINHSSLSASIATDHLLTILETQQSDLQ